MSHLNNGAPDVILQSSNRPDLGLLVCTPFSMPPVGSPDVSSGWPALSGDLHDSLKSL